MQWSEKRNESSDWSTNTDKKKHIKNVKSWEPINKRFIKLNLIWEGNEVDIIAANHDAKDEVKEAGYENFTEMLDKVGHRKEIILLGDFNAWTGSDNNSKIIGRYGDHKLNDNGERLIETCRQYSFCLLYTSRCV